MFKFNLLSLFRPPKNETIFHVDTVSEDRLLSELTKLCSLPAARSDGTAQRIPDERVQRVSNLLLVLDNWGGRHEGRQWCTRPRTYIILLNLNATGYMDHFIDQGFTDMWLPYDNRTLPRFLQQEDLRNEFLEIQNYLLTSARELEDVSDVSHPNRVLPHIHLEGSGDQHFTRLSSLGQGGFGAVDEVWSHLSGTRYARKRVVRGRSTSEANKRAQEYLVKELVGLKTLSHRHLVEILGSYTDKEYIAFLMKPVAECNLYELLTQSGGLSDRVRHDVRKSFGCLASAVHYLHESKIRHRDLSSRNVLVQNGSVFVSDLGSAHKWAGSGSMTQDRHVPTSFDYMAPEVAKRSPRSSSSDMWSLGVVFLEMTTVLVGRTLHQLSAAIEQSARSHGMEPYIWATPRVVNTWVDELQQSNTGPRHDNEPLIWIRDLLNELPSNRPKSRVLIQDILDSPSFNIFCCIECQPEFRDRHFEYATVQPLAEKGPRDLVNIREEIANIFKDDVPQPVVMSANTSFSIENWLTGAATSAPEWETPTMPGSFTIGNPLVFQKDQSTMVESPEASVLEAYAPSTSEVGPIADPLPPIKLVGVETSPGTTVELEALLEDEEIYPDLPKASMQPRSPVVRAKRARDTGLGFLEYDSPSSSDSDDDLRPFVEKEDSSGSDTESDVTVRGNEQVLEGPLDMASRGVWSLPAFVGEENRWIRTLDALPEDQEDHMETPQLLSILEIDSDEESRNEADEPSERSENSMSDPGKPGISLAVVRKAVEGEAYGQAANTDGRAVRTVQFVESGLGIADNTNMKSPHISAVEDSLSMAPPVQRVDSLDAAELSACHPEHPATESTIARQHNIEYWDVSPQHEQPSTSVQYIEVTDEMGHNIPVQSDFGFILGRGEAFLSEGVLIEEPPGPLAEVIPSCVQSSPDSLAERVGLENDVVGPMGSVKGFSMPDEPRLDSFKRPPKTSAEVEGASEHLSSKKGPAGEPQETAHSKMRPKMQRPTTGPARTSSSPKEAWTKSAGPSPKRFERQKRVLGPGISAGDYIDTTWASASSVATSVMSERTSKLLQGLSLNKWLDRDHKLLEVFCAKGNVQAVRVLLQKGCNPGRAKWSKQTQGRRIGPIMNAVKGASLRHNKCVRELITYSVDVNVVSRSSGKTPLHVAIENPGFLGYEHVIRDLVEAGADTNKADQKDDRPIMKIFYGNDAGPLEEHRRKALALLLKNPATQVDIVLPGTLNTPLHLAVRRKDPYAVGMLLHKKADVNAKNASGSTPLLLTANQFQKAMTNDHIELLRLLLETEGIAMDEKAGVNEQTALHYAIKVGAAVAVELLLMHGANPDRTDGAGRDALALAEKGSLENPSKERAEIVLQLRGLAGQVKETP